MPIFDPFGLATQPGGAYYGQTPPPDYSNNPANQPITGAPSVPATQPPATNSQPIGNIFGPGGPFSTWNSTYHTPIGSMQGVGATGNTLPHFAGFQNVQYGRNLYQPNQGLQRQQIPQAQTPGIQPYSGLPPRQPGMFTGAQPPTAKGPLVLNPYQRMQNSQASYQQPAPVMATQNVVNTPLAQPSQIPANQAQ